jgi:hypothetical protein
VNPLVLVIDDEPDVEVLFRQQFRRDLRTDRFTMEFACSPNFGSFCRRVYRSRYGTRRAWNCWIRRPGANGREYCDLQSGLSRTPRSLARLSKAKAA